MDFFQDEKLQEGISKEDKIVFGSLAGGGLLIVIGAVLFRLVNQQIGGLTLILGLIVSVVPYGIISFLKNRAVTEMERQFPPFLNDLAESKRGGMTLMKALDSAKETDYGRLNREIEKVHDQMTWGIPFPEVMKRFSRRMEDSAVIQESLSIIIQSFRSGGNITETIESVADDASQLRDVIQEKDAKLKQQLVIMYVIYFLFIGITIGIYVMLAQLLGLGEADPGAIAGIGDVIGDDGAGVINFCGEGILVAAPMCTTAQVFGFVPTNISSTADYNTEWSETYGYGQMAYYKSLLFLMLMIQGMATAAVAGQIRDGSPSAGVKHAMIMLPAAFVVFMIMVAPAGVN